jgi:gas vesicle protein
MSVKNGVLIAVGGAVIGGVLGLMFAPQSGRRTRALIRDKSVKYSHDVVDYAGKKSRHVANKAKGYVHDIRGVVGHKVEEAQEAVSSARELAQT